jgi:transposase-like protein
MTSTDNQENLLQSDTRGRVRISRERREALLDEYEKSGLSGARFARLTGIAYSSFAAWRQQRRKARAGRLRINAAVPMGAIESDQTQTPIHFLEASVESGNAVDSHRAALPADLIVELPGGARMQIGSPMQLRLAAELIALMNQTLQRP